MMNKELIKKRFSKCITTYDENAKIQKIMAEKLFSLLERSDFDKILEIGCGTGLLTKIAIDKLNFKSYTANDIVEDCKDLIEKLSPEIKFVQADIENAIKDNNNKYDLIISNAVFQWIEDIDSFISTLYEKLGPNGVLLFSTFGLENFREISFVLEKNLPYRSAKEYKEMFKDYNSSVEEEAHILAFKTPKDILKHIQLTGVNAIDEAKWTKSDMLNFEKGYNNFCSGRPTLTYNPIYIKITK